MEGQMYEVEHDESETGSLPPRAEYHRKNEKKKKPLVRLSFPLIRILLALFIILVIAAVSSPFWLL